MKSDELHNTHANQIMLYLKNISSYYMAYCLWRNCSTPYYLQMYANFTLWVRSITIEQVAAELPGLHG